VSAGCTIDACGVVAIGRCRRCRRAFCMSHQGENRTRRFTDVCSACAPTLVADRAAHPTSHAESPRWLLQHRGLELLRNAGVVPDDLVRTVVTSRLSLLGNRERVRYEPVGHAYVLGAFEWADDTGHHEVWTTGLRQGPRARPGWGEPVRLRITPGGWEIVDGGRLVDEEGAAEALRQHFTT
jgi:hypothetical protein